MNRLILIACISSIYTYTMDIADGVAQQYEPDATSQQPALLTIADHHKALANLVRASDVDGLRSYIGTHASTITSELFTQLPSIELLAKQQQREALFLKKTTHGIQAVCGALASLISAGFIAPCIIDTAPSKECHEGQLTLMAGIGVGFFAYGTHSLRSMMLAKAPQETDVVISMLSSLKERVHDLDNYPPRPKISFEPDHAEYNSDHIL